MWLTVRIAASSRDFHDIYGKYTCQYFVNCNNTQQRYTFQRFTVAEWPTHSPATLEVMGSRPTFGGISEIDLNSLCGIAGNNCDL